MTALYKAGESTAYIHNETGMNIRTIQKWSKIFRESKEGDITHLSIHMVDHEKRHHGH